ncbi:hypothetical protein [Streptomyces sp. NPDC048521]|uniref:hypothetical protein n=1 Tax=Streptomyces sp. NPDC048521 TaxID=3365566 RepID=UPI003718D75C
MATRTATVVIVECDICGSPYDMDGIVLHFTTDDEGIKYAVDSGWMRLDDGRLICRIDDFVHDMARIPGVHL